MIDNICLLIRGTLNNKDAQSLIAEVCIQPPCIQPGSRSHGSLPHSLKHTQCHPLGMFESMATLTVANNVSELYHSVIVDTPLAPYFLNCLSEEDLQEIHIEVIRNSLFKEYLEDFYRFAQELGGVTADVVGEILIVRRKEARRYLPQFPSNSRALSLSRSRSLVRGRSTRHQHYVERHGHRVEQG